jgi:hypothetical protein
MKTIKDLKINQTVTDGCGFYAKVKELSGVKFYSFDVFGRTPESDDMALVIDIDTDYLKQARA